MNNSKVNKAQFRAKKINNFTLNNLRYYLLALIISFIEIFNF